jgi:hypothetical protein
MAYRDVALLGFSLLLFTFQFYLELLDPRLFVLSAPEGVNWSGRHTSSM